MTGTTPLNAIGGNHFRVEEYKKPEFEVTVDAPTEPVMLGEKITATIKAKYYFGSPVTKAKVKYKVLRTSYTDDWYPRRPLGLVLRPRLLVVRLRLPLVSRLRRVAAAGGRCRGGGCAADHTPPEVVAEVEVRNRPRRHGRGRDRHRRRQGIARRSATTIHDHRRSRDESRRTIVGTGKVLVARKPFKVFAWVDRGYYRVGDVDRGRASRPKRSTTSRSQARAS